MSTEPSTGTTPIACDMTGAPDTVHERIAEWARLFATAYVGRERIDAGVRWRMRAGEGIEAWVRDLARREKACCPFLDYTVTTTPGEVRCEIRLAGGAVVDDNTTLVMMDEFYHLPDSIGEGVDGIVDRLTAQGMQTSVNAAGTVMSMQPVPAEGLTDRHDDADPSSIS